VQRTLSTLIALSSLTACLPLPKDAGEAESTDSAGSDGGNTDAADETASGGPPSSDPSIDWSLELELEPDMYVARMIRSPDGIVIALQEGSYAPFVELREYSSSMELLWSQTIPDAGIADLDALGGGEYLVSGTTNIGEGLVGSPGVWRVSCCAEVVSQSYPQLEDSAWVRVAERHNDGLLLVVVEQSGVSRLVQAPLPELVPAIDLDMLPAEVWDGASTPAGDLIVRVDAGDGSLFFEIGDEIGTGFGFGQLTALVGTGDELTFMTFGEDEVEMERHGSDEWVTASVPGFAAAYDPFVLDRHDHLVIVHQQGDPSEGPTTLVVTELTDDGTVVRTLELPHLQYELAGASGVVVGEDGAIYVAASESEIEGERVTVLHHIAPLE
jgi:hypothetical protein